MQSITFIPKMRKASSIIRAQISAQFYRLSSCIVASGETQAVRSERIQVRLLLSVKQNSKKNFPKKRNTISILPGSPQVEQRSHMLFWSGLRLMKILLPLWPKAIENSFNLEILTIQMTCGNWRLLCLPAVAIYHGAHSRSWPTTQIIPTRLSRRQVRFVRIPPLSDLFSPAKARSTPKWALT
jgi:hypothetical protein